MVTSGAADSAAAGAGASAGAGGRPWRAARTRLIVITALVLVTIVGVRARTPAVSWRGPLHREGFGVAVVVEVVLTALAIVVRRRDRRAPRPGHPAATIRLLLRRAIGLAMAGVALAVLLSFVDVPFSKVHFNPLSLNPPQIKQRKFPPLHNGRHDFHGFSSFDIHLLVYLGAALLVLIPVLIVASFAVVRRRHGRRRAGRPDIEVTDDQLASLAAAVDSARRVLQTVDDARAAIIACYSAMETTLAEAGAARRVTETPDELLTRAQAAGLLTGPAAARLTELFYEARYSTHAMPAQARADASQALGAISAELTSPAGVPA